MLFQVYAVAILSLIIKASIISVIAYFVIKKAVKDALRDHKNEK